MRVYIHVYIYIYIYVYILGGPTRARPTRANGGPQGPRGVHKGPGEATRARPERAQGAHEGPGGPQGSKNKLYAEAIEKGIR